MAPGQETSIEIDPGKTMEVRLQAVGETNAEGDVRVFFELNGQPRAVRVPNRKAQASVPKRAKADPARSGHVAAPMPGMIASVAVQNGQPVQPGDLMLTIEAMKMETGLYADKAGTVRAVHVGPGAQVDAKDLLLEIEAA
jgi:pyruvate carboxylase